jgi:hypothetical protein
MMLHGFLEERGRLCFCSNSELSIGDLLGLNNRKMSITYITDYSMHLFSNWNKFLMIRQLIICNRSQLPETCTTVRTLHRRRAARLNSDLPRAILTIWRFTNLQIQVLQFSISHQTKQIFAYYYLWLDATFFYGYTKCYSYKHEMQVSHLQPLQLATCQLSFPFLFIVAVGFIHTYIHILDQCPESL